MDMLVTEGVKDAGNLREMNVLADKHLAEGGIIGDSDGIAGEFEGKVEIANEPAEAGAIGGSGEGYLENGLGLLGDDVGDAIGVEEGNGVMEGLGEVEAEFAAIVGGAAPASFCEGVTVHWKEDLEDAALGMGERSPDDFHVTPEGSSES